MRLSDLKAIMVTKLLILLSVSAFFMRPLRRIYKGKKE